MLEPEHATDKLCWCAGTLTLLYHHILLGLIHLTIYYHYEAWWKKCKSLDIYFFFVQKKCAEKGGVILPIKDKGLFEFIRAWGPRAGSFTLPTTFLKCAQIYREVLNSSKWHLGWNAQESCKTILWHICQWRNLEFDCQWRGRHLQHWGKVWGRNTCPIGCKQS